MCSFKLEKQQNRFRAQLRELTSWGGTKFKFGQLILRKMIKIGATMLMSYFKPKMHQIRWGSS